MHRGCEGYVSIVLGVQYRKPAESSVTFSAVCCPSSIAIIMCIGVCLAADLMPTRRELVRSLRFSASDSNVTPVYGELGVVTTILLQFDGLEARPSG